MSEEVDKIHHVTKDLDDTKGRLSKVENSVVLLNGKVDSLGDSLEVGFKDIKSAMRDLSHRPMAFSPNMISGFIGILAVAIGAFWMVINLLYSPLKESSSERLEDVKSLYKISSELSNNISLINERSIESRRIFENNFEKINSDVEKLNDERVINAEKFGELKVKDQWLANDKDSIK